MPDLTLLHTAEAHVQTFQALAPEKVLDQQVRAGWLARAQGGIDASLRAEVAGAIAAADGPVLCTCTTLGPVAEEAGAIRIDWPMMQAAARIGGPVLMAYCLESTAAPSEALLRRAFGGRDPGLTCLELGGLWPLFESGDRSGFAAAVAADVSEALGAMDFACVVLAQASMAGAAEPLRAQTRVPVLASPEIAMEALLQDR
ncbi:aspartate/glutamate racemase family protein [Leisingera daeponensis]|uniref:Aspartate/glutamate racemase family protein n=1 Tax=Leisingera daeponensis TaxID=405746 RepID=A0ABS7NHR5_9RHOB|nr:aspartate/glutamate racemase family protein [Leisingera daeponensis]MBY6140740.1 aspartate/glutamate racemase family protein [Leisingera daeponensis]